MSIGIIQFNHVNVTVPVAQEAAAKTFYGGILGLPQIPKPEGTRQNVGAWYELSGMQLHLSIEDDVSNDESARHVCYEVFDVVTAALEFENAGINVIPDGDPVRSHSRFFVRDPGGNLIEIAQRV